jgi:hypothetical protein
MFGAIDLRDGIQKCRSIAARAIEHFWKWVRCARSRKAKSEGAQQHGNESARASLT